MLIRTVDFPIYFIECISERHFVIAGGGGSAKTGVHNQINILELVPTKQSCAADLVMKYNTPKEIPDAIMSGALVKDLPIVETRLVTGGTQATVYRFRFDPVTRTFRVNDYDALKDTNNGSEFKCVKSIAGKIITGGCDGRLITWDISEEEKRVENILNAHSKEIDDIDYDPTSRLIVTVSRDEGKCALWSFDTMKLTREFKRDFLNIEQGNTNLKFNFRSSRFAYNEMDKSDKTKVQSSLLVACNPVPAKGPSKLYKWATNDFNHNSSISVTNDGVMAMTTSLDGKLVALGTRTGSVLIFDVAKLKSLYKLEGAHHNAVTNLAFLSPKPESMTLANSKLCPLLSVSIDRRVILHRPQTGSLVSSLCYVIITVLLIYFLSSILHKNLV